MCTVSPTEQSEGLFLFIDLSNQNNMTPTEHKQYLISSIAEMEIFIDKCIAKLYTGEIATEVGAKAIAGIIDRKKANVSQFKYLLRIKYNHVY